MKVMKDLAFGTVVAGAIGYVAENMSRIKASADSHEQDLAQFPAHVAKEVAGRCKIVLLSGSPDPMDHRRQKGEFGYILRGGQFDESCVMSASEQHMGRKSKELKWRKNIIAGPVLEEMSVTLTDEKVYGLIAGARRSSDNGGEADMFCVQRSGESTCREVISNESVKVDPAHISQELRKQLAAIAAFEDEVFSFRSQEMDAPQTPEDRDLLHSVNKYY